MTVARELAALIRDLPNLIHNRAESIRIRRAGHAEQWTSEGMPREWIDQQNALPLAWASFLDTVVRRRPG